MKRMNINFIEAAMIATVDDAFFNKSLKDVFEKDGHEFHENSVPKKHLKTRREKWVAGLDHAKKRAASDQKFEMDREVGYYSKNPVIVKKEKYDKAVWLNQDMIASRKRDAKAKDMMKTYINREKDEEAFWSFYADELFREVTDSFLKEDIRKHYVDLPENVIVSFA